MRWSRIVTGAAVAAVAMTGFGVPASAVESRGAATTRLVIRVQLSPDASATTWTLHCTPAAGGSHPNAVDACATLRDAKPSAFQPVPADTMCPMMYGGPERARVTGLWNGRRVQASFDRANGCEISRWSALRALFQPTRHGRTAG